MLFRKPRIAIDGPCAAGKTTMAKLLAAEIHVPYIDTGALYRTIALFLKRNGIEEANVVEALTKINIQYTADDAVCLNGEIIPDGELRTPDIAMSASNISADPVVRGFLLATQREAATKNGGVMEGRDTTTVVMPDADLKFYLTALPLVRARRRMKDLAKQGQTLELPDVLAMLDHRDYQDMHREVAPLKQTPEQVFIDNSDMTIEQTKQLMLRKLSELGTFCWSPE